MASFDEIMHDHPDLFEDELVDATPDDASAAEKSHRRAGGPASKMRVVVWTDGSSRGNPGPGGYGAVLLFRDSAGVEHRRELSAG